MKKWTAFLGTFILSYLFWILFLMQDFNILKLGTQELVVGLVVATIVAYFSSSFFAREDGFWIFKKFRFINLIIFIPVIVKNRAAEKICYVSVSSVLKIISITC